jgi:hypothetical protein
MDCSRGSSARMVGRLPRNFFSAQIDVYYLTSIVAANSIPRTFRAYGIRPIVIPSGQYQGGTKLLSQAAFVAMFDDIQMTFHHIQLEVARVRVCLSKALLWGHGFPFFPDTKTKEEKESLRYE